MRQIQKKKNVVKNNYRLDTFNRGIFYSSLGIEGEM